MTVASPPVVGAFRAPPAQTQQAVPEIVPMRRGRPTKPHSEHTSTKPSPSPLRGATSDPFAALDTAGGSTETAPPADDLSGRFPTLDQFSLLHDSGSKFAFDNTSTGGMAQKKNISQRVTEALADEAFAVPPQSKSTLSTHLNAPSPTPRIDTVATPRSVDGRRDIPQQSSLSHQPTPAQPVMVSTGTMTSPSPPPVDVQTSMASSSPYRYPSFTEHRSLSQPRAYPTSRLVTSSPRPDALGPKRPAFLDHRSKSQTITVNVPKSPASSRPSLEGQRPSSLDLDTTLSRSKSVNTRPRPSSAYLESNLDYLRDREAARNRAAAGLSPLGGLTSSTTVIGRSGETQEDTKIASNVDFLRAMEEEEALKKRDNRSSSGSKHVKRASMPSISLSGTKTLLAGKFGDAFRRFETNASNAEQRAVSPSPDRGRRGLTPIAGSEATEGRSDDGDALEETEDVSPEMRRELERRRLSQEERRVATAGADYRKRLADKDKVGGSVSGGDTNRAASIQNKVQSLLKESNRTSSVKTDDRSTRFSDSERASQPRRFEDQRPSSRGPMSVPRKPFPETIAPILGARLPPTTDLMFEKPRHQQPSTIVNPSTTAILPQRTQLRPTAPPKPPGLRTGGGQSESPLASSTDLHIQSTKLPSQPGTELRREKHEDWETTFSKRYPSLSGLEMVETEIDGSGTGTGPAIGTAGGLRVRDV